MSRNFIFSEGEYYHCYGRGTDKRKIFLDKKDYYRFLQLLFVSNSKDTIHLSNFSKKSFAEIFSIQRKGALVDIGAYCLMPNHFHLLVKETQEKGISLFMQKLMTAYTMYFNKKYNRRGSLFESTFKGQHIQGDRYLKYIFSYIHLNPIKILDSTWKENGIKDIKSAKEFLSRYAYSSYPDFFAEGMRAQSAILTSGSFPSYFQNKSEFKSEIFEWLTHPGNEGVNVKV